MAKWLFFLIALSYIHSSQAQTPGIFSSVKYGGSGDDGFMHIIQLKNGNYVCSGYSKSNDGMGSGNHGGSDFFIVCTSLKGQLLWKKVLGGTGDDGLNYSGNGDFLSPTADGGFFFGGGTSSADGDIPASKGNSDVFIARFDENGNVIWKNTYGGNMTEYLSGIQATSDGGCIFSSTTNSNNNGDVPLNHSSNQDIWIVKLNSTGTIEWSKTYGGTNNETATCIKLTNDGGYIFTADVTSEDGDLTGTVPAGATRGTDIWVVKINSTGTITWSKRIGGSNDDDGAKIINSSTGDYYVLASSRSSDGDFISNGGLYDIVFIKISSSGTISFIKIYNGDAWDSGADLAEAEDGNIILSGITYSYDIDGLTKEKGLSDGILIKADKINGDIHWISRIGGTQGDFIRSLYQSPTGETIAVGETSSSDGDFTSGPGGFDAFIIKIAPYNAITGYVYYDYNGNGVRDTDEPLVENVRVISSKNNSYAVSGYTNNGYYRNEVDSGNFVTRPLIFNANYYSVLPDSLKSSFAGYYGSFSANFGLKPIPGRRDIKCIMVPMNPARAGMNTNYKLICYNSGTDTVATGKVTFYKDARTGFISSIPTPGSISGDTISWSYSNFKPLDTLVFNITLSIAGPPLLHNGFNVVYKSVIDPVTSDLVPGDNTFFLYHTLTGSYDPNDKEESHGGIYSITALSRKDFMTYTIRFQNTGNDTAFHIVIKDTLDSKLEINSFEMLATSLTGKMSISNHICTWDFSNTNLPDSIHNEPASHGFITYRIKPSAGVQVGDQINNKASIYFDYNDPVDTRNDLTIVKDTTLPEEQLILEQPEISGLAYAYCSNGSQQKIRLLNMPRAEYQAVVSANLDQSPLIIYADSTVIFNPAMLNSGSHTFSVSYKTTMDSSGIKKGFTIVNAVTPVVKLSSNLNPVTNVFDSVMLTASEIAGGGSSPSYSFAKDIHFTSLLQPDSNQHTLTLPYSLLNSGINTFYVRMRTSDSCYTSMTAVDSINIEKTQTGTIIDSPASSIVVSPNPFGNDLIVKGLDPGQTLYFKMYDVLGKPVFNASSIGQKTIIFRPQTGHGIFYFIIYNVNQQKIASFKLLKE